MRIRILKTSQNEPARDRRDRGQMLAILAISVFVAMGFVSFVVDVSWYWASSLRVQRAADAAALAGVVYLPGNVPAAVAAAKASAAQNGFADGAGGIVVTPVQDPTNDRRLGVSVSAPIGTFFMRLFGISSIRAAKEAKAEFILSVPMGSPLNYYGIDKLTRAVGATTDVPEAKGSGTVPPQGFWGAVITKGGNHQNGDAYSPENDDLRGGSNSDYDDNGYPYEIVVPSNSSNVRIHLFDPGFCGVGPNASGGYYGTGDHWIGASGTPVSTYYDLWNENGTPLDWTDDTLVASSGTLFENEIATDQNQIGGAYEFGTPQMTTGATNCATSAYHNKWWEFVKHPAAGTYRLMVSTTSSSSATINSGTNAENMFGIEITSSGKGQPEVHGAGRMAAYNNLAAGSQTFYLAQVDRVHAGKTLEIDLFDPGDVTGDAFLKILSPDGGTYKYSNFTYTADSQCTSPCSGSGTSIQTHFASGGSPYNNSWIRILIPLPSNYGSAGLTPAGEPSAGWWKIEYTVAGGNDTTTWRALIVGNPVHLIVP